MTMPTPICDAATVWPLDNLPTDKQAALRYLSLARNLERDRAELLAALRWTTDVCDELLRDGYAEERAHIAQARVLLSRLEKDRT